ncbi:MAG: hypothetical protein ACI85F_000267 [Bacteroidia bacterium]
MEKYTRLCSEREDIPIFLRPNWLNATVPGQWDVCLAEKGSNILGAMPYFFKKKMGFRIITMPPLTPFLGPIIFYPEGQKPPTRLSFEKEVLGMLIEQLPETDKYIQYFHPEVKNALPFHWKEFEQSVRYTNVIKNTSNVDACWDGLQGNIRRAIKKAEKEFSLIEMEDPQLLHQLKLEEGKARDIGLNYDAAYFDTVYQGLKSENGVKLFGLKDTSGNLVSSVLLAFDKTYVYYLAGSVAPSQRQSGALSLLLWNGIQFASEQRLQFNFEGSMKDSIAKYFQSFGGEQIPYFEIKKIDSKLLKLI